MVINATGVVAHTNLGRSILSQAAARRVADAAAGYLDLEYDLKTGERGDRMAHLDGPLQRLFPGHSSMAVNNNAGAILLALRALARGREVVVSRGELVEIGGAFRVPDILAASGAKMKEVGTTNRTRAADYEAAIGPKTALLLKVHTSNFKIVGFTDEASVSELAGLARAHALPLVVDWGSGDLIDLAASGVRDEIPVAAILEQGADLVTFSGDKLLGGPQAGIVVGRDDLLKRMRKDPMARVLRLDRLQIAALRETLTAYVTGRAAQEIPTLVMLGYAAETIGRRAESVARAALHRSPRLTCRLEPGVSRPGGGSSPAGEIPTTLLVIEDPSGDAGRLEIRLRRGDPPVIARINGGKLLLDLRTVLPEQDETLARCLADACQ
jgi:L-seryl-tRNA(Ser) seleniumtransferase